MCHVDRQVIMCCKKCSVKAYIADVTTSYFQFCKRIKVNRSQRSIFWKSLFPYFKSAFFIWNFKFYLKFYTSKKCIIKSFGHICRKYRNTIITLHALEEKAYFYIGISIVTLFNIHSLAK